MLKCVDFFCGGGGMSVGMKQAGVQVLAAIDNDQACKETYEANHPDTTFLLEDIKKYNAAQLAVDAGIEKNDDHLIFIGCAPCQYWSIITGSSEVRKEKSKNSLNLLQDFLRFVRCYKPGYVVIENVRGITRNEEASGLSALLRFFDNNGYRYDHRVISVSDYGVPQTRQRYVLIASRNHGAGDIRLPSRKRVSPLTVRDAIGDGRLKKIAAGERDPGDFLHRSSRLTEINIRRLKLTPEGGTRDGWANHSRLMINAYKNKPLSFFRENYGRMSWDAPAPTITTRFFSLGCGRFGHPEQDRCISLREGALLQTFPKRYQFKTNSLGSTARIIGNAVPPKLAKALGDEMIKHAEKAVPKRMRKHSR